MNFAPYYDESIKETIDTVGMHNAAQILRSASIDDIYRYYHDVKTECAIDPSFMKTKMYRVVCKAMLRGIQRCRNRGERLTVHDDTERVDVFGVLGAVMEGMIIGDEWAKRFG